MGDDLMASRPQTRWRHSKRSWWRGAAAGVGSALILLVCATGSASAATAITNRPDCNQHTLPANDDGSTGQLTLPFALDFLGTQFSSLWVNNNGNVTLNGPLSTFTPFPLANSGAQIIAPYFADVDTRGAGSGLTTYGTTTVGSRTAFCALWDGVSQQGVGYYAGHTDKLNKFQLLLVDRSDTGPGNFDMIFNYDQIQWETGDASGGSQGFGGTPATVGYANGTNGGGGTSFELPGSRQTRSFLDSNAATGLANNSRNSAVIGRYVFPIRNGAVTGSGSIAGTVSGQGAGAAGTTMPIADAVVQACGTGGSCVTGRTTPSGTYTLVGVTPDSYTLTANPPASAPADLQTTVGPVAVAANAAVTRDIVLLHRVLPPPGTFSGEGSRGSDANPVLYWTQPSILTIHAPAGCTVSYDAQNPANGFASIRQGSLSEGPPGTYTTTLAPFFPFHGPLHLVVTILCGATSSTQAFDVYIDPSGKVVDTHGAPVVGATVTLSRADASTGPFTPVPQGDAIMSPANRVNPDTTDAQGRFGWDVTAGFYTVTAQKAGCHAPGNAGQASVSTDVLTIPPPVTGLTLTLDCGAPAPPASCVVTAVRPGPPAEQDVTVQAPAGLSAITNIQITNGTVSVAGFTAGTAAPVVVTATKTTPGIRTVWSFDATDAGGNVMHCS